MAGAASEGDRRGSAAVPAQHTHSSDRRAPAPVAAWTPQNSASDLGEWARMRQRKNSRSFADHDLPAEGSAPLPPQTVRAC